VADESEELTVDSIAQAATDPASGSVDGRAAEAHPLPDQLEVLRAKAAQDALAGTNSNGGAKSGWGATRPAVARFKGGT
jgi:hypothetical protein